MIEIVYKEETEAEEVNIKLPRNIKQIGTGGGTRKVYIEDYAASFVKMHPREENSYRYGVLLGEIKRSGALTYIFVRSAVEAHCSASVKFDDEIWTGIYEDIKQHFSDGEIVGWFLNIPMMERESRMKLQKIHLDNFAGNDKICFFYDRSEKEEAIYAYDSSMMQKRHGYYIFYEKNPEMQNYMVIQNENIDKKPQSVIKFTDGIITRNTGKDQREKESKPRGRLSSFVYSASSVLVVAVLICAVAMMNNYGQMQKIKKSMENLADNIINVQQTTQKVIDANNQPDTARVEVVKGEVETTPAPTQPVPETTTASIEAQLNYYTVEQGETLSTICKKIYGNQEKKKQVMEANGITDENMIYVGQKIILP